MSERTKLPSPPITITQILELLNEKGDKINWYQSNYGVIGFIKLSKDCQVYFLKIEHIRHHDDLMSIWFATSLIEAGNVGWNFITHWGQPEYQTIALLLNKISVLAKREIFWNNHEMAAKRLLDVLKTI